MSIILIRGAAPYGGDPVDLAITDGTISRIGPAAASGSVSGSTAETPDEIPDEILEASGCVLLPGLVDLHTHLREPGGEAAETVLTGTRAAAAGGFTAVHAMANTVPASDSAVRVEHVADLGREAGYCAVMPIGAVTRGLGGRELAPLEEMADSRAAVTMFSDDGTCVSDPLLMYRALERTGALGAVIAQHAQEPALTAGAQVNGGPVATDLGLAPWPGVAEDMIIARDALLARATGARLHVCHLSTRGAVEVVRWAKSLGIAVTAEVTPHHLLLTDDLARTGDAHYKVNPPLRTADDVEAVRAGLADGTIDTVGTDHAPHPSSAKECGWTEAANGMTGLETALAVVQQVMVDSGHLTWHDVARVLSEEPARIGGDPGQGRPIAVGEPANLVVWDPSGTSTVHRADHVSRSDNTPYADRELPGRHRATIYRGRITARCGRPVPREALA